jgi:hypothetical protein
MVVWMVDMKVEWRVFPLAAKMVDDWALYLVVWMVDHWVSSLAVAKVGLMVFSMAEHWDEKTVALTAANSVVHSVASLVVQMVLWKAEKKGVQMAARRVVEKDGKTVGSSVASTVWNWADWRVLEMAERWVDSWALRSVAQKVVLRDARTAVVKDGGMVVRTGESWVVVTVSL